MKKLTKKQRDNWEKELQGLDGRVFRCVKAAVIKTLLTDAAHRRFEQFIYGQTCGLDMDTREPIVYGHDFERFIYNNCPIADKIEDWD